MPASVLLRLMVTLPAGALSAAGEKRTLAAVRLSVVLAGGGGAGGGGGGGGGGGAVVDVGRGAGVFAGTVGCAGATVGSSAACVGSAAVVDSGEGEPTITVGVRVVRVAEEAAVGLESPLSSSPPPQAMARSASAAASGTRRAREVWFMQSPPFGLYTV
jgi:hypothetical protein